MTLLTLNLNCNAIGDEGAAALAKALRINLTLQTLRLDHNDIGDKGATSLCEGLKSNPTLQTLCLCGNNISGSLRDQIRSNRVLV